jgi:hypothetical protein
MGLVLTEQPPYCVVMNGEAEAFLWWCVQVVVSGKVMELRGDIPIQEMRRRPSPHVLVDP